ncbi:MAG: DUF4230 domain-containing protein [Chloroflexi bacterium]|nr:DUF4230 domain-containing protein [Chloroflexota bacterium]
MRKLINLFLFIIFAVGAFTVYRYVSNAAQLAGVTADPVLGFIRDITVRATPAILPDRVTIVRQVNTLARLETASYEGEKVVTSQRGTEALFGAFSESMVFVAYGEVIAGVDLMQMSEEDIQVVDPTTVMIHLPPAEVFVATLDNELSYVADRDTGLLTSSDPQLETAVRLAGQEAILEAALEYGLIELAQTNAETYMENFLRGLGFETIIFTEETPPPPHPTFSPCPRGISLPRPCRKKDVKSEK